MGVALVMVSVLWPEQAAGNTGGTSAQVHVGGREGECKHVLCNPCPSSVTLQSNDYPPGGEQVVKKGCPRQGRLAQVGNPGLPGVCVVRKRR